MQKDTKSAFFNIVESIRRFGDEAFVSGKTNKKIPLKNIDIEKIRVDSTTIFAFVMRQNEHYDDFIALKDSVYTKYYYSLLSVACEYKSVELHKISNLAEKQRGLVGGIKNIFLFPKRKKMYEQTVAEANAKLDAIKKLFENLAEFEQIYDKIQKNKNVSLTEQEQGIIEAVTESFSVVFEKIYSNFKTMLSDREKQTFSELLDKIEIANGREKKMMYEKISGQRGGEISGESESIKKDVMPGKNGENLDFEKSEKSQTNGIKVEKDGSEKDAKNSDLIKHKIMVMRAKIAILFQNLDEAFRVKDIAQIEKFQKKLNSYLKEVDEFSAKEASGLLGRSDLVDILNRTKNIIKIQNDFACGEIERIKGDDLQSDLQKPLYLPDEVSTAGDSDEIVNYFRSIYIGCVERISTTERELEIGLENYDKTIHEFESKVLKRLEQIRQIGIDGGKSTFEIDETIKKANELLEKLRALSSGKINIR